MSISLLVLLLAAEKGSKPEARLEKPAVANVPESQQVNLLGRTNTASGESRRNENIQFNLIDNNALKELSQRMGTTATIFSEMVPERTYYGGEYGNAPPALLHVPAVRPAVSGIHGTAFWMHSNSATSARSFFQVGGVKPARENHYGVAATLPLWKKAWLSLEGTQQKLRGQVNGNILIPTADERSPLTTDPQARALISQWMAAWPAAQPNRTDIDPRALNTNAPQSINTDSSAIRLDQLWGTKDRLTLRHAYTNQVVDAFQFVAGQNPDTTTKNHNVRITWQHTFRPSTIAELTAGFDRVHSLLVPEPNAVGPQVQVGTVYTALGPTSGIPIDRVQNRYRYGGIVRHQAGRHGLSFGGEVVRLQFNGRETSSNRGNYYFRNDFGRDAITNFRLGIPNRYSTGIGDLDRGFRNWEQHYFASDIWRATNNLTVNYGVRYQPQRGPYEVNNRTIIPYHCDCNNFAPRLGLAWRLPRQFGVLRAAYGLQYGEIFPTTFQQLRWNPPEFLKIEVQTPSLLDPLANADLSPDGRSTVFVLPEDLKSPYSHQYNASWEAPLPGGWRIQLGYVGSRSHKIFAMWYTNRAALVPGIPQITATINDRRPDQRYFELRKVMNASNAYFDAARATLLLPSWRRVSLDVSYWFSKAIDTGSTYLNTAAGDDSRQGYSQSELGVQEDLKGPSLFDQSHAFLLRGQYELPRLDHSSSMVGGIFGRWVLGVITLAKTGMPFTVITGSDGPGFGNIDGTNGDRPNLLDPSILGRKVGDPDTSQALIPRSAFTWIPIGQMRGNLGNGVFRRGGIFNLNTSVSRTWPLRNERAITFRAESVNFSNTPQFAEPIADLTNPAFGKITNTLNDGRSFRFNLQLRF